MQLTFERPYKSILGPVVGGQVNDFVVLSGENGSGKSQLLEAIEQGAILIDGHPPNDNDFRIRRFASGELVAVTDGPQTLNLFRGRTSELGDAVRQIRENILNERPTLVNESVELEAELERRLLANWNVIGEQQLADLLRDSGKPLLDFDAKDFACYAPLIPGGGRDPFQLSISEIFLRYHASYVSNKFNQWLEEKGEPQGAALSDETFTSRFGPPPWDLLDRILASIGLDYQFIPPQGTEDSIQYEVLLRHGDGSEVSTDLLSSGEKTLLAIAMSLYVGNEMGDSVKLPQALLLDEADASLHPSMINVLLKVIRYTFVAQYGVRVILTTHSPTTVALAPEESLYVISRSSTPRLRAAPDRDAALRSLTVGLTTLSVRLENRRTVFVESEYDQAIYQALYVLLEASLGSERSLDFVASGRGGQGNSQAVVYLVEKLRDSGNTAIAGIVDRDGRQGSPKGVFFNDERYSIENFVLDPLALAVLLVREGILDSIDLGLRDGLRHFEFAAAHAPQIVARISERVFDGASSSETTEIEYLGGFTLPIPRRWLDTPGHELEQLILATFPPLNRFGRDLCREMVTRGFADVPIFIPKSVLTLFGATSGT